MRPGDYVVVERSLRRVGKGPAIEPGRVGRVLRADGDFVRVYFWRGGEVYTHRQNLRHLQHGVVGRKALRER